MKITEINHHSPYLKNYREIYQASFPAKELVPFGFIRFTAQRGRSRMLALIDKEECVGMAWNISYKDIEYIFFLAIDASHQGQGYGSRFLQLLQQNDPDKRIILCIEPVIKDHPDYEQRLRRLNFYNQNGFHTAGITVTERSGRFDFLINKGNLQCDEYKALIKYVSGPFLFPFIRKKILINIESNHS